MRKVASVLKVINKQLLNSVNNRWIACENAVGMNTFIAQPWFLSSHDLKVFRHFATTFSTAKNAQITLADLPFSPLSTSPTTTTISNNINF